MPRGRLASANAELKVVVKSIDFVDANFNIGFDGSKHSGSDLIQSDGGLVDLREPGLQLPATLSLSS